uniref:Uncharacterized protein n=1 Tax=Avena sativa TaxID=4498 RepID=A0ACD5WPE7_AVESA
MAASGDGGGEHRVCMRPARHGAPGGGGGGGKASAAAGPEVVLNRFVRCVALIERLGNALGTLAFTWATVVLLGGYSKDLSLKDDFWFATAIVFLEATRMFTARNNRQDYQLFFNTRGAFRPAGWNGLIMVLYFFDVWTWMIHMYFTVILLVVMVIILSSGRLLLGLKLHIWHPLRRATSLWSPLVAILLMAPRLSDSNSDDGRYRLTKWIVFITLLVPVLLVTISRLRFTGIIKLVDSALGSRQVIWRRVITNLCMIAALGMQTFMLQVYLSMDLEWIVLILLCALVVVSFGNFQIPAAVLRIVLASLGLQHKYKDDEKNLAASLRIFYGMVLVQGIFYAVAGMLEYFSFIPRRFLLHHGGFRGQWGVESVHLYYAYALEKCMQDGVLAPKKISLSNFAMDSLNKDSSKNQLYGIRMMHSFLQQREPTKAQLLAELADSADTVARIIRMLDWKRPKDTTIRLYAAKVTAELAKNLCVATFPGAMKFVSALLDDDSRPKRGNPLMVVTDDEQEEERKDPFLNTADSQEQEQGVADNQDTDNLLETQTSSTQQPSTDHYMLRCWKRTLELLSTPKEQPATDHDILPAVALTIIENLADCDEENCVEISNTPNLIPKIIVFTRYRREMNTANTEAQQKIMLKSSLEVLQRLTCIDGEIGITLRYKISKHPFLVRNLAEILGENRNYQELKMLAAGILRNMAVDGETRQDDIGRIQLTLTRLMQAFLNAEGTMSANLDHLLRKVAGQALAMLTMESANNCLFLLKDPQFISKLKTMILINDTKYIYVAASLLRNLCLHARHELKQPDLKELSHTLREVLERIIDAEGAELEILIGLSSQICKVIPKDFTRELENGQIKRRFVKRLIHVLNTNTEPSAHCPGIRRVILEQVINMAECKYAHCFNEFRMTEALSMVEQTLSETENYRLFLGDAGLMEYSTPISALLANAKELI